MNGTIASILQDFPSISIALSFRAILIWGSRLSHVQGTW